MLSGVEFWVICLGVRLKIFVLLLQDVPGRAWLALLVLKDTNIALQIKVAGPLGACIPGLVSKCSRVFLNFVDRRTQSMQKQPVV